MNMEHRFIKAQTQHSNSQADPDIENPMLVAIVRICHVKKILSSILFIAEYTFTPLLILMASCI